MQLFSQLLRAFLLGGALCLIGQLLIDKTSLTPAKILTLYVVAGVVLGALGLYEPLVNWGGAGATVPLTGFGYALAREVELAVAQRGLLGAMTGGVTAGADAERLLEEGTADLIGVGRALLQDEDWSVKALEEI